VTVLNPAPGGGTSNAITFTINPATPLNPLPALSSMWPSTAPAGSADLVLWLSGSSFVPGAAVLWNSTALETTYINSTQATAVVPAGDLAAAGSAAVAISNPAPGGGISGPLTFSVTAGSAGTVTAGSAQASVGGAAHVPVTLSFSGVSSVDSVAFGAQITPDGSAPALTGSLAFVPATGIPTPTHLDTAAAPNMIAVDWVSLGTGFSVSPLRLGEIVVTLPPSAAVGQSYTVSITGASAAIGTTPVALSAGTNGTLAVARTYLVGDTHPLTGDNLGQFGDSTLNILDLIMSLRAVTNVLGCRPQACTDRFDAMDSYPVDNSTRGGDGQLNIVDLIISLRRVAGIDTSRPTRTSRGLCTLGAAPGLEALGLVAPEPAEVPEREAAGRLLLGGPELAAGFYRVPVYLEADRDLALMGLAWSVGLRDRTAPVALSFGAGDLGKPAVVDTGEPGTLAVAHLEDLMLAAGQRLLLGYVQVPAAADGTAPALEVYGAQANTQGTGESVPLRFRAPRPLPGVLR
jgi:hypothetical protein